MDEPTALEWELETLAEALPFLIARDDERPPLWLSLAFAHQVAAVRSRVAGIASPSRLATRLHLSRADVSSSPVGPGRFETAARRLGGDPTSVALAIRWLEIQAGTRLPTWSEMLRHRALQPAPAGRDPALDASIWFG